MKKLIILLFMALCMQATVIAKASKKQKHQKDFALSKEIQGFEVDFLTNKEFKTTVENKKFWGLIEFIVDLIAYLFGGEHGKYSADTKTTEGPYFIFDRSPNGLLLTEQIKQLRAKIKGKDENNVEIPKDNYDNIYKTIYENATINTPTNCNDKAVCLGASIAKDAAFVYVVGLKKVGNDYVEFNMNIQADFALRNSYKDKALSYLNNLKGYGLNNGFDLSLDIARAVGSPALEEIVGLAWNWGSTRDDVQFRTKELMMIVQTIDMLEWAHKIDINLSSTNVDESKVKIKDYVQSLYRRCNILGGMFDVHNNYTLMPAASIGAAAIALKDFGHWAISEKHKHPKVWAEVANYNIENTMWHWGLFNDKESKRGEEFGFLEGPHYFRYSFELLLPYFKARYNLKPENFFGVYYNHRLLTSDFHLVRNPFFDKDYDNLYSWSNKITLPNATMPIYKDAFANCYFNGVLALRGNVNGFQQLNWVNKVDLLGLNGPTGMSLHADYLATLTVPKKYDYNTSYKMTNDLVGRELIDAMKNHQFYIHVVAKVKDEGVSFYHDHGDVTSFIIGAGTDILAIDPGLDRKYQAEIELGKNHNVITVNGSGPDEEDYQEYKDIRDVGDIKELEIVSNYYNYNSGLRTSVKSFVKRKIKIHKQSYPVLIEIEDEVKNNNWYETQEIAFNINGNGDIKSSKAQNSFVPLGENGGDWFHPCIKDSYKDDNWHMQAFVTSFLDGNLQPLDVNISSNHHHATTSEIWDNGILAPTNGNNLATGMTNITAGTHARISKNISLPDEEYGHFRTTILLKQCSSLASDTMLIDPVVSDTIGRTPFIVSNGSYVSHLTLLTAPDTMLNFSMSRSGNIHRIDTAFNPFRLDTSHEIISNASSVNFKYSLNNSKQFGCCNSITNFRSARISNGDMLVFKDTIFINATKNSDAFYTLVGKYKYQGYIQCDSLDSVSFYLPDADSNYAMGAVSKNGNLHFKYNDTTHTITLIVPKGFTEFMIQLDDPCLMNCYFPTALDSIKNTFDYNTGLPEALPYKLTITPPNGLLKIRNNSQMSICAYKWLHNKDSLILDGPCPQQTKEFGLSICPDVKSSLNNNNFNNKTEITLNPFASLILDSGSYTRFGNNTRLVVLPNANFIIRKNAILDIGDEKGCGHAEIICHPGSYVHFEDSADIKFWKIPGDTNDIHLFYIAVKPPGLHIPAHAGIERSVLNMLVNTDNIALGAPGPICGVAQIKPDWGINNRDWGFANFAYPKAWAYISKDSFCKNECPEINFDRMLNDVKRSITFCRIDTNYSVIPYQPIFDTCVVPQKPHINTNSNGDLCDTLLPLKNIAFCDLPIKTPNHWYRITLTSTNDCNQTDTKTLYYFVLPDVHTNFSLPQTACPNNIVAIDLSDSNSYKLREKTRWHVHLIDTNETKTITKKINYGGDWEYLKQSYPDTFTFPNFKWIGGYSYAVSYTATSRNCGDTIIWDTINVYPGAQIVLEKPTVYSQLLNAATSVKLHGYTSSIDSFKWEPTTWLDSANSLTPISTPFENITYVLSAYKNGCTATDTAFIKYNTLSYIGNNDTLCTADNMVLLGNKYNAPLFLGWLNKYNGINLKGILSNKFNDDYRVNYYDSNYLKYFNTFMFTSSFADVTQRSGCYPIYNIFTSDTIFSWEQIFRHPNFKNYYYDYVNNSNWDYNALDGFNTFIESTDFNPTFAENSIDESNASCINQLVEDYQTYYTHVFNNDAPYMPPSIYWYKIVGNDTTEMTKWRGQFLALDSPTVTTTYIQQIFHTDNSAIDIDIKTVHIDSVITPLYYPALQFDSTIYFMNNTEPISGATNYEWNFGDGSPNSFEQNPIHTFPAFDSNYVVCLTASNKCNSWQYCDTVWVDSLHLGGALKTANKPAFFETSISTPLNERLAFSKKLEARSKELVALQNYPNPFNQSTIIDYQIWQSFNQAELRITNILGQVLFSQKLQKPFDKVEIDGSNLANGLYYYSIVVDNSVKLTKTMSVIH